MGDQLSFKIEFENPDYVSIGMLRDQLEVSVVDSSFFSNMDVGAALPKGHKVRIPLPRMQVSSELSDAIEIVQQSAEITI